MKTTSITLLLSLFLALRIGAQCDAPTAVKEYYRSDANQLALRVMTMNLQYQDSVAIPAALSEPFLQALLAVYNAEQYPERDSVVECYAVKAFPIPNGYSCTLGLQAGEPWVQNLHNGIYPTGNDQVDQLMNYYHLEKASSSAIGNQIYADITGESLLHMSALAKRFEGIPGVNFAEASSVVGDGNDITYSVQGPNLVLQYNIGWGDCPAGCTANRWWTFSVAPDCSVAYLGVDGDDLDFPLECSNAFQCATAPLCMSWLRDSIDAALTLLPDCNNIPQNPGLQLLRYEYFGQIVWGLKVVLGSDAEHTRFYTCDGTYLGKCDITIAGLNCDGPVFIDYLNSPVVWDCTQSLPTPAECGLTNAPEPPGLGQIQVTPNPARSTVTILLPENTGRTWEIFNVTGLSMGILRSTNQALEVTVSAWPAGVYVVRGRTAAGALLAGKFVVLR